MVFKNPKIDLNKKPAVNGEFNEDKNQFHDTTLRLECSGHGTISREISRPRLVLGLGPTPSVCSNDRDLVLKLSLSHHSDSSKSDLKSFSNHLSAAVEVNKGFGSHHVINDEGSSSTSGGYMPFLLLAPRSSVPLQKRTITEPKSSVHHDSGGKTCIVAGCSTRTARIRHGCKTGAQGTKVLCKVHGGGKRCIHEETTFGVPQLPLIFHEPVSVPGPGLPDNHSLSGLSSVSSSSGSHGKPAKRRQMIPPQVLVPLSMKSSTETNVNGGGKRFEVVVSEGRVYGGSLLSSLTGNRRDAV